MEDDYSYDYGYDYSTTDPNDPFEQDWADVISGNYTFDEIAAGDPAAGTGLGTGETIYGLIAKFGSPIVKSISKAFQKPDGSVDWRKVATLGGGIAGLMGAGKSQQQPSGYQGKIPKYTAVREQVEGTYDPTRRPGSGGQRYFSDVKYASDADKAAAKTAATEEAAGLAALNAANPARQTMPVPQTAPTTTTPTTTAGLPAAKVIEKLPVPTYAQGGIAGLKSGRYLNGATDGMADKIATSIEGKQPAALSHGEFVVPADVVSHLGNGNSEAGAKKLYEMMAKVRQARTGTPKQGKQINPNKYLPA